LLRERTLHTKCVREGEKQRQTGRRKKEENKKGKIEREWSKNQQTKTSTAGEREASKCQERKGEKTYQRNGITCMEKANRGKKKTEQE